MLRFATRLLATFALCASAVLADGVTHLVFDPPADVKASGKHVVLIAGDEEYRTEESCPLFAKMLSQICGHKATVLFPMHPDGYIDPNFTQNIPGLEALKTADLMVIGTRHRDLPDEQLQHIYDYLQTGKPVFGFRTATHAFQTDSAVGGFDWNNFGPIVLGTGWVNHHGEHKKQGCLGIIEPSQEDHPSLRDIRSAQLFSMADVYGIRDVTPENATILLRGAVTHNLSNKSSPIGGEKNDPMMPLAWLRNYQVEGGQQGTAFCTTMGASTDFGMKRPELGFFINMMNFLLDERVRYYRDYQLEDETYRPTFYSFVSNEHFKERNIQPSDHALGNFKATQLDDPKKDPRWRPEPKTKRTRHPRTKHEQPQPAPRGAPVSLPITPANTESIVVIGNSFAERFLQFGHFESQVHAAFPSKKITFRNLGFPGDTAGFRPRAGNDNPWAFPSADKFWPQYPAHIGTGHEPTADEWLTICRAQTILACFGFNESFAGPEGIENFKNELRAFVDHTHSRSYAHNATAPQLVLISPTAFEDRRDTYDLPSGEAENANLKLYAAAMREVATEREVGFIDLFTPTYERYVAGENVEPHTLNGCHLNDRGYAFIAPLLTDALFGKKATPSDELHAAVMEKNWFWKNDYRILNGVHVYGQRYAPFGNYNYPEEIEKIRQMTHLRDQRIWAISAGEDISIDDSQTRKLSPTPTNYMSQPDYLAPEVSMEQMQLPDGYAVELFASEREFPELANPGQMSFDDRGRLWVSVCPSYPHYRPGDDLPNDKLLILEDTDGDGLADKCTTFADGLHLPFGFEFAPGGGVYLAEQPYLTLIEDTDGDDRMDKRTVLLDGFDPHDTHHAFSAFSADASGALIMPEGRFLHSQIETPYGVQRAVDGSVWRFQPQTWRVDRLSQTDYSNPWGICFNEYGQNFVADASGGANWHLLPLSLKMPHGAEMGKVAQFTAVRMRPTAGADMLYSRHFPAEMQGDFLLGNTIGFLGIKQQQVIPDGSSYRGAKRQDLIKSFDPHVRVADLEVAPDGSVYFIDWHNALIGHMQHSARDPLRDHQHGRVYRIFRPDAPLVEPAQIVDAPLEQLFENLKLPEYRSRYRTRRQIATFSPDEVKAYAEKWAASLDPSDSRHGVHLLEALWTTWAQNSLSDPILDAALSHTDSRVRAAAVRVVRHSRDHLPEASQRLIAASKDEHSQVRLEALTGASWLEEPDHRTWATVMANVLEFPTDRWARPSLNASFKALRHQFEPLAKAGVIDLSEHPGLVKFLEQKRTPVRVQKKPHELTAEKLDEDKRASFLRGYEIYHRDAHCATCHQADGNGLAEVYPPLTNSRWVTGDQDRLIKLTLHGLMGPIEVAGKKYAGQVPMTPFGGMLNDQEIADVLNYIRNDWGNSADKILPAEVGRVREETKDQQGLMSPAELLIQHPMK